MSARASVKLSISEGACALAGLQRCGVMALGRRFLAHLHQHVNIKFVVTLRCGEVGSAEAAAGRVRYLQPTELRALLEACSEGLRQIVALAVSTGMRRGQIINLRYLDVDMANRRIM